MDKNKGSSEKDSPQYTASCMICGQPDSSGQLTWGDNNHLLCPLCLAEQDSCGCHDEEGE